MAKVPQSEDDLKKQLSDQMGFLQRSMEAFDAGVISEGKRIALAIRVLVHDTGNSTSLLKHLNIKDRIEYGHSKKPEPDLERAIVFYGVGREFDPQKGFFDVPILSDAIYSSAFDEWWDGIILINVPEGLEFSRRKAVLAVANTDGGAHVGDLDSEYAKLSREGFGWVSIDTDGNESRQIDRTELVVVRQAGHELFHSIESYLAGIDF
jgi:hypothetical protein